MAEALTDNFTNTRGVSNSDLRIPHVFAFGAEIGMNSLASLIGFTGTFFIVPQVAVDMGLGLSVTGLHTGVRGRYLFSPKKLSPFAYGGVEYSSGLGTYTETLTDNGNSNTLTVTVNAATFIDAGLGFDFMANNGFYWVACFGWSQLLGGQNFAWAPGSYPTSDDNSAQKLIDGSGPTLSFSGGYAF